MDGRYNQFVKILCFMLLVMPFSTANEVIELSDENFSDELQNYDVVLVMFYAPWCGHCKKLSPEFVKAASVLKKHLPPITLARVDCTSDGKETCKEHGVKGYPTVKAFVRGQHSFDYDGPRDAGGMVTFMKSKVTQGEVELVTEDDFEKFLDSVDSCIIGFFEQKETSKSVTAKEVEFHKVSNALTSQYRFAHTYNNRVMTKYGYRNDIVLFRSRKLENKMEPVQLRYEGYATVYNLRNWIVANCHGLVGYRTIQNREHFQAPYVVMYLDSPDFADKASHSRYLRNRMMMVAQKFTEGANRVTFAVSDAIEFKRELIDFGLGSVTERPLVAARDSSQKRYTFRGEFSVEYLENFVNDLLAGKLTPYVRSEAPPVAKPGDGVEGNISDVNTGPIKVIVAATFSEIIQDPTKDVLLMLGGPGCGRCKAVEEIWTQISEKLTDDKDIIFAKMDAVANEVPHPYYLKGLPSIFYVARGSRTPKFYEGEHQRKEFIKFIAREATTPLKNYDRNGKKKKEREPKTEL